MNWCAFAALPLVLACWCASSVAAGPAAPTLYVATNGNDAWSGRLAQANRAGTDGPLATLSHARDEVRKLMAKPPAGGIAVEIAGGVYQLSEPLQLSSEDSGTETGPIEYCARPGEEVRLVGGQVVTGWERVTDASILERLAPNARETVL